MYRGDRVRVRGREFFDEAKLAGDERPILPATYVNHHADTMVLDARDAAFADSSYPLALLEE